MKTINPNTLALLLAAFTTTLHAQNYSIDWYNVSGGGGCASAGGRYSLSGAIGQSGAGAMAGGSYSLSAGFLDIGATAPTPVITWADPAAIVYGSVLGQSQLNATASVPGSFAYSPAAGTLLNAGTASLWALFTPNDAVDYTSGSASVSLVVLPAPLSVTASNATRLYGAANPAFNGSMTGLVNGDSISVVYSCAATTTSPPGAYPIVPALVDPANRQSNYQVTLVNGTLTVASAAPQAILSISPVPGRPSGTVTLSWGATAGQMFQVQYKTDLSQADWVNLVVVTAADATATASDALNPSAQRFYRILSLP
jgi:hypothetical protein